MYNPWINWVRSANKKRYSNSPNKKGEHDDHHGKEQYMKKLKSHEGGTWWYAKCERRTRTSSQTEVEIHGSRERRSGEQFPFTLHDF